MAQSEIDFAEIVDFLESELHSHADPMGIDVDDSLVVGLLNYSQHLGVRDLPVGDLKRVLVAIGEVAIDKSDQVADGSALQRSILSFGCDQSMGNCKRAAETVLDRNIEVRIPSAWLGRDLDF